MHAKYFFLAVVVFLAVLSPAAGSLTKIEAGAPVYLGEQDLNIAAGLQGCRALEWYEPGADLNGPAQKNVTIIKNLEDSDRAFSYTIHPEIFSGYDGTWYCEGKRPLRPVFEVIRPNLSVRFWDLDKNADVTGQTVPLTSNVTFRIDTNLDTALQLRYRPEMVSLDSFYSITLTDPAHQELSSVYTGSYGKAGAYALVLEKNPIISASPYFWKDGSAWDRTSRNIQGEYMYPAGTYTITVSQNLNHMQEMYADVPAEERAGRLEASATITFVKPVATASPAVTTSRTPPAVTIPTTLPGSTAGTLTYATPPGSRTTVPTKTTYAPLPFWIAPAGLGCMFAYRLWFRK